MTMAANLSSVREEDRVPTGSRICVGLVGVGLCLGALLLQINHYYAATVYLGLFGLACLVTAVIGTKGDLEYVGLSPDACPECRESSSLEVFRKISTEQVPGLFSSTTVTTKTPMIRCMNVSCSYERQYSLHQRDAIHQLRKEAFMDMNNDVQDAMDEANHDDRVALLEANAENAADALAKQDSRQELRNKKLDKRGTLQAHPDSQRLVEGGFGLCPDCGNTVNFQRWIRKYHAGPFSPPIALEMVSFAECIMIQTCGYIAKLKAHKKTVQDAGQQQQQQQQHSMVEMV